MRGARSSVYAVTEFSALPQSAATQQQGAVSEGRRLSPSFTPQARRRRQQSLKYSARVARRRRLRAMPASAKHLRAGYVVCLPRAQCA